MPPKAAAAKATVAPKKGNVAKRPPAPKLEMSTVVTMLDMPFFISGAVTFTDGGYQIGIRRRGSSKVDTYHVPTADIMAAGAGEAGYLLTKNPVFSGISNQLRLTSAKVTNETIEGLDDSGNSVYIDRTNLKVAVHSELYETA